MDTLSLQWRRQAHIKLLRLIHQIIWMWSRLISSQEMLLPVVTFATLQIETILLVKPWDRAGHAFNSELLGVLMHMRPLFMVMFPIEPVILPEHLLFCFCSRFWKECVSTTDEPCQGPLDDAWSYTAPPRCLASFMNRLSSLFGALLVWHHAAHVHQSIKMSRITF